MYAGKLVFSQVMDHLPWHTFQRGHIPAFIHISDGKLHDVNVLELLLPEAAAFYREKALRDRYRADRDTMWRGRDFNRIVHLGSGLLHQTAATP